MIRESLLADFDQEMAATRKVLERVPEPMFGWTPHQKSYALGALATHIAQIPHWGEAILDHAHYDVAGSTGRAVAQPSRDAVLATFDTHARGVRDRIVKSSDAELAAPWELRKGTQTLLSVPKFSALRRFLLHHVIHHRGQLTVYLRLQDVPLPPLYGPTADDSM